MARVSIGLPRTSVEPSSERREGERRANWPANVNRGLVLIRLVVGLLFVGHASQKLFGWFGGSGMGQFTGTIENLGMRPAAFWAYLAAGAELLGGLFLALGLLTPFAAAALIGNMVVAIAEVHGPKGLWATAGGFEYNLVLVTLLCPPLPRLTLEIEYAACVGIQPGLCWLRTPNGAAEM